MRATGLLLTAAFLAPVGLQGEEAEARISLDVKDAPVQSIVQVLVELGGRQVVFDGGVDCSLTLKLHGVRWAPALDVTLRACGLAHEEEGGVFWVATAGRLREEAEARRRLKKARGAAPSPGLAVHPLSYARAESMLPLLQSLLAPSGKVTADPRTNTLLIRY